MTISPSVPFVRATRAAWVDQVHPDADPITRAAMLESDDPADWAHIEPRIAPLPRHMREAMAARYRGTFRGLGRRAANRELGHLAAVVRPETLRLASSDEELRDAAEGRARVCAGLARGRAPDAAYPAMAEYARRQGIEPPAPDERRGITTAGCVARLCEGRWWRRALRRSVGRRVEAAAINLRLVHRQRGTPYASEDTVKAHRAQRARNQGILEQIAAINEDGQEYTLAELADLSTSNPRLRHSELMARIAGFDALAVDLGHAREFWTLTTPSRFHRMHSHGEENRAWDGSTPREAQAHLAKLWARVRAFLARRGVRLYGVRVAEPHHDGTPHWHALIFFPARWPGEAERAAVPRVRAIVRRYALHDSPDEPGARAHRFRAERIDPKKGSAAAYLIKYVAKHTGYAGDGPQQGEMFGDSPRAKSERVNAWASRWGIRQFQFLGGPPVTVWRELRRMDYEDAGTLEAARRAADAGDWAEFVRAMGGPLTSRADQPVKLVSLAQVQTFDKRTGDLFSTTPTRNVYGEAPAARVVGVSCGNVVHVTRWHTWKIGREALRDYAPARLDPERAAVIADYTRGPGRVARDAGEFSRWLESRPDVAALIERARARGFSSSSGRSPPLEFCQ